MNEYHQLRILNALKQAIQRIWDGTTCPKTPCLSQSTIFPSNMPCL